jgi:prepilin-type N-terminal cleavage/methylation domain-containing protein
MRGIEMKKIQSGFNLVELMVVIAIIGLLAAFAIPMYQDYIVRVQLNRAVQEMLTIRNEIEGCVADGKYGKNLEASLAVPGTNTVDKGYPCASLEHTAVASEMLDPPGYHTVVAYEERVCLWQVGKSSPCDPPMLLYVIRAKLRQDASRSVAAYLKSGEDGTSGVTILAPRYDNDFWRCAIVNVHARYAPSGCEVVDTEQDAYRMPGT